MKIDKHPLFYRDRGNLIRNYYCSECLCGPFLKEDIKKGILIELGGERQAIRYCRKCYNTKRISLSIELPILSEEVLEREKYIASGKALENLRNRIAKKEFNKRTRLNDGIKDTTVSSTDDEDKNITIKVEPTIDTKSNEVFESVNSDEDAEVTMEDEVIEDIVGSPEGIDEVIVNSITTEERLNAEEIKKGEVDLTSLSAKEIVNLVRKKTGKEITASLKSKKTIIRQAKAFLEGAVSNIPRKDTEENNSKPNDPIKPSDSEFTYQSNIDLCNLSAKAIVDLVKEKTGKNITVSLKSKKSIIRQAQIIFKEKGFKE